MASSPRPHAQSADAVRRELQRLRAELAGTTNTGTDLTARVEALEAALDDLQLEINHADPDAYNPDLPPLTAHDRDDEFSDDLSAWTTLDPSGHLVSSGVEEGYGYVTKQSTALGNGRMVALYQDIPSGNEWAFAAKMTMQSGAGTVRYGLFVAEDLDANPTTANFYTIQSLNNTSVQAGTLTAYDAAFTGVGTSVGRVDRSIYLRARITDMSVTPDAAWDWSDDGVGWNQVQSAAVGFTPVHFGVWVRNSTGSDARLRAAWFRAKSQNVGLFDLEPGGRRP